MKTLLLGLGNNLRGDDAIGLEVVEYIRSLNQVSNQVNIEATLASGIHLLSYFPNYERVCIVDSVQVEDHQVGRLWKTSPEKLRGDGFCMRVTHGIGIHSLVEIIRKIGYENPREVLLFLIGIQKMNDYFYQCDDNLSSTLRGVIPHASKEILATICSQ